MSTLNIVLVAAYAVVVVLQCAMATSIVRDR